MISSNGNYLSNSFPPISDVAVFDGSQDPQPSCYGECNPPMPEDPSPSSQASCSIKQEKQGQLWL